VEGGQRGDRGSGGGNRGGGMDEPVLPLRGEQVGDLEDPAVGPAVAGGHEDQLRAEAHAEERGQCGDLGRGNSAVKLVAPHQADVGHSIGVLLGENAHELGQAGHGPTISTIWRSSAWSGGGSVMPRTRRAVTQMASGTSGHRFPSPTTTPGVGAP